MTRTSRSGDRSAGLRSLPLEKLGIDAEIKSKLRLVSAPTGVGTILIYILAVTMVILVLSPLAESFVRIRGRSFGRRADRIRLIAALLGLALTVPDHSTTVPPKQDAGTATAPPARNRSTQRA